MLLGKVNRVLGAPHPALETWSSERERGQSTAERERERKEREGENSPSGAETP